MSERVGEKVGLQKVLELQEELQALEKRWHAEVGVFLHEVATLGIKVVILDLADWEYYPLDNLKKTGQDRYFVEETSNGWVRSFWAGQVKEFALSTDPSPDAPIFIEVSETHWDMKERVEEDCNV